MLNINNQFFLSDKFLFLCIQLIKQLQLTKQHHYASLNLIDDLMKLERLHKYLLNNAAKDFYRNKRKVFKRQLKLFIKCRIHTYSYVE